MNVGALFTKQRVFIALMILSAVAAIFGRGLTSHLRHFAQLLIAPLGDGGMYVVTSLRSGGGDPELRRLSSADIQRMAEENRRLREQLVEMERRLAVQTHSARVTMEDIQRIRSALVPSDDTPCELIPARVVAADSLGYGQTRVLNRGRSQGAEPGAPVLSRLLMTDRSKDMPRGLAVLTASALVGRVVEEGPFTARMQLVTDRKFEIRGRIIRRIDPNDPRQIKVMTAGAAATEILTPANNRPIQVLARGDGGKGLIVRDVPEYEHVRPGDWLVTAGDDPYLRTEVRIGTVVQVRVDPDNQRFTNLRVRPFEDLDSLRRVYIVYWQGP
jgi:cell shape-determining protein MreC